MAGKFWENIKEGLKKARPDDETKQLQESFNKQRAAEANAQNERLKTTKTVVTEKITPKEAAKKTGEDLEKNNKILTPPQQSKTDSTKEQKKGPAKPKTDSAEPKKTEVDAEELAYERSVFGDDTLMDEGAMTEKQKNDNEIDKVSFDYNVKPLTKEQQNEVLKEAGLQPQRDLKDLTDFERFMIDNGLAELDENGNLMKKKYSPGLKYILGNVGTIASVALSFLTGGRFPPIPVNKLLGQDKTDESARKFYDDTWKAYVDAKKKEQEGKGEGAGKVQETKQIAQIEATDAEKAGWNKYKASGEYDRDMQLFSNDIDKMIQANTLQKDLAGYMQKLDVNRIPALVDAWEGSGRPINELIKYVQAEAGNFSPEWLQKFNTYTTAATGVTTNISNVASAVKPL